MSHGRHDGQRPVPRVSKERRLDEGPERGSHGARRQRQYGGPPQGAKVVGARHQGQGKRGQVWLQKGKPSCSCLLVSKVRRNTWLYAGWPKQPWMPVGMGCVWEGCHARTHGGGQCCSNAGENLYVHVQGWNYSIFRHSESNRLLLRSTSPIGGFLVPERKKWCHWHRDGQYGALLSLRNWARRRFVCDLAYRKDSRGGCSKCRQGPIFSGECVWKHQHAVLQPAASTCSSSRTRKKAIRASIFCQIS
eukprot:04231_4